MPIASDQLLNQIGTRLLQHLRESRASDIRVHDIVNILKTLRHSGYAKASFYSELEHLLIAGNFINNCNMTQAMQILRTFETFKICPSKLLESLTKRVKLLLKKDETSFRIKDIGSYVNMLGIYQYKDAEENDVFSVCADVVLQQLQTGIRMEPLRYTAMYLSSCATGLLYAGKFNEDIVDALFGIPNVVDYLEGKQVQAFSQKAQMLAYEPSHDKSNKLACAPSKDSDQPGHPPSLIRVFAVHSMRS